MTTELRVPQNIYVSYKYEDNEFNWDEHSSTSLNHLKQMTADSISDRVIAKYNLLKSERAIADHDCDMLMNYRDQKNRLTQPFVFAIFNSKMELQQVCLSEKETGDYLYNNVLDCFDPIFDGNKKEKIRGSYIVAKYEKEFLIK